MRHKIIKPIFQRDSMQCGVASLAMICSYYGRKYTLTQMEHYCHATRQGVSLKGIMDAAHDVGLKTKAGKCSTDNLIAAQKVCLLHWNQDHFVVLNRITGNGKRFHLVDPAKGKVKLSRKEFEKEWIIEKCEELNKEDGRGIALFFEPTNKFYTHIAPTEPTTNTLQFLMLFLKRYKAYFLNIALGLLLLTIMQLAMPFLMQGIVDMGISRKQISLVWLILIGELVIVIARMSTDFIRRWLLLHVAMRINVLLKGSFLVKLLKLPMTFFEVKLTGDLLQRFGDHTRVQSFMTDQILGIMFTIISLLVFGTVLLYYNTLLFCIFCGFGIIYGGWIRLFLHQRRVLDTERFMMESRNSNCTYEFVTSIEEIKIQDCRQRRRWNWENIQADLMELQIKSLKMQQVQEAGSTMINEIKNLLMTALTAVAVIDGTMTFGEMLAVQYIIGQLNSPLGQLMSSAYAWQDLKISLDRINEIHNEVDENQNTEYIHNNDISPDYTLKNVSFRYDVHAPNYALQDLSFTIPAGKTTAIVGASGSGKSTLIKLLLGYYKPEKGKIIINGKSIEDINIDELRRRCGVVMQNGVIFSDTIERNIACVDGNVDIDKLHKAASMACLDELLSTLPLGMSTRIGRDGVGLSQGQKQRILIARALYRNPDIMIMDEATNSLDANNERAITEHISAFLSSRTAVIVAHRLSTVKNADNIVVLDNGRIVESGKHDELVALRGKYYNLVSNQLELGV